MKHSRNKKSGQILVLMALLASTLAILMGMVVSVGHLVQSKINLQTAVDLAAMSGASWQARYQSGLGVINYRMRQNYKWLLFDVYVTQSRFNGTYRSRVDGGRSGSYVTNPEQVFAICQQSFGYQPVRSIGEGGRGTNDTTDMCKNAIAGTVTTIPPIVPSAAPAYNPIYIAINAAIAALGTQAQQICADSAGQNLAYLDYTTARTAAINSFQADQFIDLTREFSRAFGAGTALGSATADATMLSTFNGSLLASNIAGGASLQWVTPQLNRSSPRFIKHEARLFMNYVDFQSRGGCIVRIDAREGARTPTGFSKRIQASGMPANPLNVALRGQARPNILFWPRGIMPVMVAVGAAKAFGSRIGPPEDYYNTETFNGRAGLVNMNFFPNDLFRPDRGIFSVDVLRTALSLMPARWSGRNQLRPLGSFMPLVNAPTIYDALYFNTSVATSSVEFNDMIPNEVLTGPLSGSAYQLLDRGSGDPGMHIPQTFRLPGYYASEDMVLSSWAPLYDGSGNIDPSLSRTQGRQGYQIKLTSIAQLCLEMGVGGGGTGVGFDALCGGPFEVYH